MTQPFDFVSGLSEQVDAEPVDAGILVDVDGSRVAVIVDPPLAAAGHGLRVFHGQSYANDPKATCERLFDGDDVDVHAASDLTSAEAVLAGAMR